MFEQILVCDPVALVWRLVIGKESVEGGPDGESDFDYIESTSEAGSSSDEEDAEKLEAILGAVFTSSPSKGRLEPAERQSLLLFDKD